MIGSVTSGVTGTSLPSVSMLVGVIGGCCCNDLRRYHIALPTPQPSTRIYN